MIELELQLGITKHKAATFAEAEMLARAGVRDVMLAYSPVGSNIPRAVNYVRKYSDVVLSVIADHPMPIKALGAAMANAGQTIDVLLDIDTGQHRTGIAAGPQAKKLYQQIVETDGLNAGGLHVYDGQNHQTSCDQRKAAVDACWHMVKVFRDQLADAGWPVPRIVAGGTGSFPIYAEKDDVTLELSPGTCVFHDVRYGQQFPDLPFTPAALLLTRVVSRPTQDRITLDVGYKAVAADSPAGHRLVLPDLPDAEQVLQSEEYLVLLSARASHYVPGDELLAIPRHVCPTVALHRQIVVVSRGRQFERWNVVARDRCLSV